MRREGWLISLIVPSCYVIFDLETLSLSFDLVFNFEILKSFSLRSSPRDLFQSCHLRIVDAFKEESKRGLYVYSSGVTTSMYGSYEYYRVASCDERMECLVTLYLFTVNIGGLNGRTDCPVFQPPPSVVSPVLPVVVPILADTTSTPSSTTIDQDALSASTLSTTKETQALVIHQVVKEQQQGNQNAQFDNDPFINICTLEPSSEESSSRDVIPSNLHQINQPFDYLRKWIKDHPLDNVTTGFNKTPTPNRCHVVLF
ncbi:hypothetical protein Tco_1072472 [Tanacetum coccineum]